MTPFNVLLAKRLAQKIPENMRESLDAKKFLGLRLAGIGLCLVILLVYVNYFIMLLVSLLCVLFTCLLREVATQTDCEMPTGDPLYIFSNSVIWLLLFSIIGWSLIFQEGISALFIGFIAGGFIATFILCEWQMRLRLHREAPNTPAPAWTVAGYALDNLMYLMPLFALANNMWWFLVLTVVGTLAMFGFMMYRYYKCMQEQKVDKE